LIQVGSSDLKLLLAQICTKICRK